MTIQVMGSYKTININIRQFWLNMYELELCMRRNGRPSRNRHGQQIYSHKHNIKLINLAPSVT